MKAVFEALIERCLMEDTVFAVITAHEGSAPRKSGAVMLANAGGRIVGTVGGGAVEYAAEREAAAMALNGGDAVIRKYALHPDEKDSIGMVCGGAVSILFARFPQGEKTEALARGILAALNAHEKASLLFFRSGLPFLCLPAQTTDAVPLFSLNLRFPEPAVIFGAGHVGKSLCPLLASAGFAVTVADDRPELLTKERFPDAETLMTVSYENAVRSLGLSGEEYVIVMTNGHEHDYELEAQLLQKEFAYIGVIGSRKKTAVIREKLLSSGISPEAADRVHAPVGLNIGAVTPEEIAISIAAEMILCRHENRLAAGETESRACPMHE